MGALGPVSGWIPEDDLLLKNAVEAGASLESLAKGAVKFSKRFSIHELRERWYSLLYDPVVSTEASTRMIESERSASSLPSKVNKVGVLKENKDAGKRKSETVQSCYYALRKRICSEPFESMDLSFLVAPGNSTYIGDVDGHLSANCSHGDPILNPFGLQVPEMDTMAQAFPDDLMDASATFPTGLQNLHEENFQIDQDTMHGEFSHILEENMPLTVDTSGVGAMGDPKHLPDHILFKTGDQVNADQSNMRPEFEGNKISNSPVSGSYNNLEYSPLPGMPIWKTVSAPVLPVDIDFEDKCLSGDTFQLPDDYDSMNTRMSGYDVHAGVKVKIESAYEDFQVRNSPEGYLAEISNSLLNFTNEEELFMNGAGKDIIDKSYFDGLSSLLLNSPNDNINREQVAEITEPNTSAAPDVGPANSLSLCHESNRVPHSCDEQVSCDSQNQVELSISTSNVEFPELKDGVICCVLNTEDPDIPCNDVPLQLLLRSKTAIAEQRLQGASIKISSPAMDLDSNQRTNEMLNLVHKEQNATGISKVSSQEIGSNAVQGMGENPAVTNFGVPKPDSAKVASISGSSPVGSELINVAKAGTEGLQPEMMKDKSKEVLNSTDCSTSRPAIPSASINGDPHMNIICIKEESDAIAAIRDQEPAHTEPPMNIAVSEPILNAPADQDELSFESDEDDDIPYYSDIEAMILDMDLDPDVQDLNDNEEVSRYHQEDTKRTIIRLEQSAHAHMQRAIASHGALAILYGRHSKHYIKKPEVLLGRATNEDTVDIDLGREGLGNKISRKQAMIMMDKGGSFSLTNLSKFPICVNCREIGFKQSISLKSSCLIEIRGMAYIFETNQTCVKKYLDGIPNSSHHGRPNGNL